MDQAAARHYEAELRAIRRLGMRPMLTLNHFTLPTWLHDPIAVRQAFAGVGPDDPPPAVARGGWLDERTVREFGRFAAWAAWRYGDLVDLWVTINEPMVVAVNGYVNVAGAFAGWFPPGSTRSRPPCGRCATSPRRTRSPTTPCTARTGARGSGRCRT